MSFTVSGRNLGIWTKYDLGADPELNFNGLMQELQKQNSGFKTGAEIAAIFQARIWNLSDQNGRKNVILPVQKANQTWA